MRLSVAGTGIGGAITDAITGVNTPFCPVVADADGGVVADSVFDVDDEHEANDMHTTPANVSTDQQVRRFTQIGRVIDRC